MCSVSKSNISVFIKAVAFKLQIFKSFLPVVLLLKIMKKITLTVRLTEPYVDFLRYICVKRVESIDFFILTPHSKLL